MIVRTFRFLLVAGSVILLQACGGGGRPTSASGTITSTAASSFVSQNQDTLQKSTNAFDSDAVKNSFVSTSTRSRMAAALGRAIPQSETRDLGCTPTAGGDSTDGDGDNIPVSATYSFSGCSATLGTYSGGFTFADADDTKALPLAGFRMTIDNFGFSFGGTRESIDINVNGFFNVTVAAPTITTAMEMEYKLSAGSQSAESGIYLDASLTPTSMSSAEAGGTLTYTGFFRVAAGENDYTLAITSSDLVYERPCNGSSAEDAVIKSGTLTIKDGSNNTITGTFSNCTPTWKFNDETLTITR